MALLRPGRTGGPKFVGSVQPTGKETIRALGPLHDPAVIAWPLAPEIFVGRDVNVEIETAPGFAHGQTIVGVNAATGRPVKAHWLTGADKNAFYGLVAAALARG